MNQVINILNSLGFDTVEEEFYNNIDEWKSWYKGDVEKFHRYKVRNGDRVVKCRRYSLGMAKKICEDWANVMMNEKVSITLEGEKEQEFLQGIFERNNFEVEINRLQELTFALGTGAVVPRAVSAVADMTDDGAISQMSAAGDIALDFVSAEHIYPLRWENGVISECAFDSRVTVEGENYIYLQIHTRNEQGEYVISNRIYHVQGDVRNNSGALTEVNLSDVRGYEQMPASVETGSAQRQFVIIYPNITNNWDYLCPLGISIFSNCIDVLQGIDIVYDSYVNEFILGKKRIMVNPAAAQFIDGTPAFDTSDLVFYVLPEDTGTGGSVITPIDMSLRTGEHNVGIQDQLNILSSKCGFGEKHYNFNGGSVATATQVISENSTMFRSIKKHEIVLESALKELVKIILSLGNSTMNAGLNEDVEITIDFDDSIIEDKESEFARDSQLLSSGIMNDWEFRMKWMNEDEETAKANLPSAQDLTDEESSENDVIKADEEDTDEEEMNEDEEQDEDEENEEADDEEKKPTNKNKQG